VTWLDWLRLMPLHDGEHSWVPASHLSRLFREHMDDLDLTDANSKLETADALRVLLKRRLVERGEQMRGGNRLYRITRLGIAILAEEKTELGRRAQVALVRREKTFERDLQALRSEYARLKAST
jgi:chromosome condensin MukBEF complex kleisin-like MukF subunit